MMISYRNEIEPLSPYVAGRPVDDVKREYGISYVVKIASNENPLGCSKKAKEAIIKALESTAIYPDGNCTELRSLLSEKFSLNENQLTFGTGADEIISSIGKTFVSAGDECITSESTFSQYATSVISMGGKMIYTKLKNHGFDLEAMLSAITEKTKIIFIANPNNPTGTFITKEEQIAFLKKVPSNVMVVLDEAYMEFVDKEIAYNSMSLINEFKNVMVLKTFSKAYGLASLRVGYGVAHEDLIVAMEKIRNPFNVSIPAQAAACACLSDIDFLNYSVETNKKNRDFVSAELEKNGIEYIPSQANFIMIDTKKDSRKLFTELMKNGYIIRGGYAFGMDTFIRVSIGTIDEMKGFLDTFFKVVKSL